MTKCVRVHYWGRVQGVGFRFRTKEVAARYNVAGTVRNLPDGQVELVAQGPADEVDTFLAAVDDAMAGYIAGRRTEDVPAGDFTRFEIRRD